MTTKIPFTAKFVIPGAVSDTPAQGTVTIAPSATVRDPAGNVILTTIGQEFVLDGTGTISGSLYATDDSTVPSGWSYVVTEKLRRSSSPIAPAFQRVWNLAVPKNTVGTLDLADVTDAQPFQQYQEFASAVDMKAIQAQVDGLAQIIPTPIIDVVKYGAQGNAMMALDASVTSGSKVVTSSLLTPFTGSLDAWFPGAGAAGALLKTTITCTVAGTGTLAVAASTTVNNGAAYWGTDDTTAFQAAISAAMANAATIVIPNGRKYFLSQPLVMTSTINTQPQALPSLVSESNGGAIGDELNHLMAQTSTALVALPTFPLGNFLIDYRQTAAPYASTGVRVKGFSLICNNLAAGFRMQGPREARISDLTIVSPAAPAASVITNDSATGAFSISTFTGANNSAAYNQIDHITVWNAGNDSFFDNTNAENTYTCCRSFGPANANYRSTGYANNTYLDCHYGGGQYGVALAQISGAQFIGLSIFNSNFGYPTKNALIITGGWQYDNAGYYPPSFTNCRFINAPNSGVTEADGATIRLAKASVYYIGATFTGCYISAVGTHTSDWAYSDSAISGGYAIFRDCVFNGTVTNKAYNDQSNLMQFYNCVGVGGALAIPSSGELSTRKEVSVATTQALTASSIGQMFACTVTSGSPYTVTLPTPVGNAGNQIAVRVTPSSTDLLTLATAAGNIDGSATRIMWAGESAILESDGTNWVKIAGKTIPMFCQLYLTAASVQLASATISVIPLETTRIDNTGKMATLASNAVTIRRPGTYSVQTRVAVLNVSPPGGGIPSQMVRLIGMAQKNGATTVVQQETSGQPAGSQITYAAQDDVVLAASDTVKALAYQAMAAAGPLQYQNGSTPDKCQLSVREVPSW